MQCCVTGPAFEYLLQQPNQALVQAVMLNSVAFTRMRSHQKGQLMDLLGRKGLHHMLNGQRQHILVRILVLEPPPHVEWSTSTYTGKNPRIGAPSVSHCVLICLSLCLSACLSVCLSVCPYVCLRAACLAAWVSKRLSGHCIKRCSCIQSPLAAANGH